MILATALASHQMPIDLIESAGLARRMVSRGGDQEYQFHWRDRERLLPVLDEGVLRLVAWGCRRGESRVLPATSAALLESIQAGRWEQIGWRPCELPGTLILEGEVWALVREGVRGLLALDEHGREHVYLIVEPASYYYKIMTRGLWMPVLIGGERF